MRFAAFWLLAASLQAQHFKYPDPPPPVPLKYARPFAESAKSTLCRQSTALGVAPRRMVREARPVGSFAPGNRVPVQGSTKHYVGSGVGDPDEGNISIFRRN
jgi:hypothetical protein